jgi:tetratricopeptide (TPR) repeat protein
MEDRAMTASRTAARTRRATPASPEGRTFDPRFDEAGRHWDAGDPVIAIQLTEAAVQDAMANLQRGLYLEGRAFARLAEWPLALLCFSELARIAPDDDARAKAEVNRSRALALLGRGQDALDAIDRALSLGRDPDDYPRFLAGRALALAALDRPDEALRAADDALRVAPHDANGRLTRAEILARLGRPDDALADLDVALLAAPSMVVEVHLLPGLRRLADDPATAAAVAALELVAGFGRGGVHD